MPAVTVEDQTAGTSRRLVATLPFTSLGRGDYVIELTATSAGQREPHYLAIRIN